MNTPGVSRELREAANKFSDMLSSRPVEEQLAVSLISKNVLNGCSWEFTRPNPELRQNLDAFKASKVCSIQEVTYNHERGIYGYLVCMQMDHLSKLLGPSFCGPLTDKDLQIASKHRQEAQAGLIKKIKTGYKGKIGIYCTNDSQTITVDGKTYPAFAISMKELCTICKRLQYGILVNNVVRDPMEVLKREDAVLKSLTVAPSSNALFITIGPMGN